MPELGPPPLVQASMAMSVLLSQKKLNLKLFYYFIKPGFLKLFQCGHLCVCVCVSMSAPETINNQWHDMDPI